MFPYIMLAAYITLPCATALACDGWCIVFFSLNDGLTSNVYVSNSNNAIDDFNIIKLRFPPHNYVLVRVFCSRCSLLKLTETFLHTERCSNPSVTSLC